MSTTKKQKLSSKIQPPENTDGAFLIYSWFGFEQFTTKSKVEFDSTVQILKVQGKRVFTVLHTCTKKFLIFGGQFWVHHENDKHDWPLCLHIDVCEMEIGYSYDNLTLGGVLKPTLYSFALAWLLTVNQYNKPSNANASKRKIPQVRRSTIPQL